MFFLVKWLQKVARATLRNPSNTFLEALKKDAWYGEEMRQSFRHSLQDFQVLSFYETREFHKAGLVRVICHVFLNGRLSQFC